MTLGGTPSVGNVCIAVVTGQPFGSPVWGNGWTLICQEFPGAFSDSIFLLYRYVQGGDTTTVPIQDTSAVSWNRPSVTIHEVSGISATWGTAFDQSAHAALASSGTPTISTLTPANANELAIIGFMENSFDTSVPTISAGWSSDESDNGSGPVLPHLSASKFFASGTVTATITVGTAATSDYVIVLLNSTGGGGGGGTPTGDTVRLFPGANSARFFPTNASRSFPHT